MPGGGTLRSRTLEDVEKVKWDPAWGKERMHNMIATRPDWCISRQRVWGVPIAVFLCESCGKPLNDPAINSKVVDLFARSGADAWYTPEADTILPAGTKCPALQRNEVSSARPIFSTSGWSPAPAISLCVRHEPDYPWPSDLYLEGGDQYRGWFQSSLLCAMGTRGSSALPRGRDPGLDARREGTGHVEVSRQ